ncbi:M15 family metallopeptidase [Microbulbifer sp. TYP-18]|uniref:M15 family metallopeptidase n=1 Tax=Microbulbifer sp. TYP-18 TaxID=3230024 RepID=UPI0034C6A22E
MMRLIAFLPTIVSLLIGCSTGGAPQLVSVASPGISVDMKYFSGDNLVGEPLDGYRANKCLLAGEAAAALQQVATDLRVLGVGLVVFDCYRPQSAVNHFVRWASTAEDHSTKERFYPREEKAQLFARGYIAQRSGHSRGATVDLGLYDLASGNLLDMGTPFDFMDERSATEYPLESSAAYRNRMLLRDAMRARGFVNYPQEWWHFTYKPEPWPDQYFDVPVE